MTYVQDEDESDLALLPCLQNTPNQAQRGEASSGSERKLHVVFRAQSPSDPFSVALALAFAALQISMRLALTVHHEGLIFQYRQGTEVVETVAVPLRASLADICVCDSSAEGLPQSFCTP